MLKSYDDQVQEQIEQYRHTVEMHDLPRAFHLWSDCWVRPGLTEVFNVININQAYVEAFVLAAKRNPSTPVFLSLGCGDGAIEIGIARTLLERGISQFRFVCYDLSPILLSRFRAALPPELSGRFELRAGDLNDRAFDVRFDAIMANHSLHHMVDLEGIFRTAYDSLTDDGIFVTNDMIGRNGHMRWPETRLFVDFFWPFLSERQRNNVLLHRPEPRFVNHDCSTEGFEGIRSQEVLPLILAQGFKPSRFLGFGGMIDVFVDRCFGPNFDVTGDDDFFLLQRLAILNDILLDAGVIKPTMMLAYFVKRPVEEICYRNRSAHSAIRQASPDPSWLADAINDLARSPTHPNYVFKSRPPSPQPPEPMRRIEQSELDSARAETAAAQAQIQQQGLRIAALENSTSWQVTAPLRVMAQKFRRRRSL